MHSNTIDSYVESPSFYILLIVAIFSCLSYIYSQFINMSYVDNLNNNFSFNLPTSSKFVYHRRIWSWTKQLSLLSCCIIYIIYIYNNIKQDQTKLYSMIPNMIIVIISLLTIYSDGSKQLYNIHNKFRFIPIYGGVVIFATINYLINSSNLTLSCLLLSIISLILSIITSISPSKSYTIRQTSNEYTSELFNYLTFSYLNDILIKPGQPKLELSFEKDVPTLSDEDSCSFLWDKFNINYGNNINNKQRKLFLSIFSVIRNEWITHGFFQLVDSVTSYISPLALGVILHYVDMQGEINKHIIHSSYVTGGINDIFSIQLAVLLLFLGPFIKAIVSGQSLKRGRHIGIRVKAIIIAATFHKSLNIDFNLSNEGIGSINNFISSDTSDIQEFMAYSHQLWSTPIEMLICIVFLFFVLGVAAVGGVIIMFVAILFGLYLGKELQNNQFMKLKHSDNRMRIINELLNSIRIIKLFAWESAYQDKVGRIRADELKNLRNMSIINALMLAVWEVVPVLVSAIAFIIHVYVLDRELTPSIGFTSLTLFNLLKFPLQIFPEVLNASIKALISTRRIGKFLNAEDVRGLNDNNKSIHINKSIAIEMNNATIGWKTNKNRNDDADDSKENSNISCYRSMLNKCYSNSNTNGYKQVPLAQLEEESAIELTSDVNIKSNSKYSIVSNDDDDDDDGGDPEISLPKPVLSPSSFDKELVTNDDNSPIIENIVLEDVTISIPQGSLAVIIGSTGGGKSSIISSLLGENYLAKGSTSLNGSVSYVTQSPWIMNATLKENILFGNKYDKKRYEKVLFACSLITDIKLLADGDLTEIGERGINLSGGQQQRVNLARAAYSASDIILLDDPLSAVDSKISKHIFDELIVKFLSNRTRLLVTHNISYCLPTSDIVICIDKITKKVAACCHPTDLSNNLKLFASQRGNIIHRNGSDLFTLLSNVEEKEDIKNDKDIADISSMNLNNFLLSEIVYNSDASPRSRSISETSPRTSPRTTNQFVESILPLNNIIIVETKSGGDIALEVYQFYINALGGIYSCLLLLVGNIMISFLSILQTYSLGKWMNDLAIDSSSNYSLFRYISVNVILVICTLIALIYQAILSIRASDKIHYNLLISVLLAPVAWFDSNPIGRICNRFSQDISDIDNRIMESITNYMWCSLNTIQIVSIIAYYLPFLLIPFIPVICFTFWVSYSYLHVSRELKRLESLNKSPLFALFSESLTGLSVIRSFKHQERFFTICKERIDNMNRPNIYLWLCNRWLNFRMQILGSIVTGAVGFTVVQQANTIGSIAAGLSLLYSLNFCDSLTFLARSHADVQMAMNSAERVKEYSNLKSEKYLYNNENISKSTLEEIPSNNNRTANWPSKISSVEFKNLSLEYQLNQPVLKNVSFKIPNGKKLGIVGRTGSGKSSLIVSLFRLFEPMVGSKILIDDKNILDIDLIQLRSAISIVPQDPTLFSGNIKSNLDPFNDHTEEQLWKSLKAVQLTDFVESMPGNKLNDKIILDKGSNLSVGQRQLLCLARAILRDSSVLVLDECTANVDYETDDLIQKTVQNELTNTTVLCIAHRLLTIAYYDLILVMDAGEVKEYDSPLNLLQQDNSIFKEMCIASGDYDLILESARTANANNNAVNFI